MNFGRSIDKVVEKLSFSNQDYNICVSDIKHIETVLDATSKKHCTPFKDIFNNIGSTATFMQGDAIDLMPDFNYFLPFKVPLKVKPIFSHLSARNLLRLKSKMKHASIVKDGYVSAEDFHILLSKHVEDVIDELKKIECGPRVYQLSYSLKKLDTHIMGYNIMAIQVDDTGNVEKPIEILFDFVPVFKFLMYENPLPTNVADNVEGARYWITCSAFIKDDISVFCKVTPYWQLLKADEKSMARNAVRLIMTIARKHCDEHILIQNAAKNAIFWRYQKLGEAFEKYSLMTLFMDLYERLTNSFASSLIPSWIIFSKGFSFKGLVDILDLNDTFKGLQVQKTIDLNDVLDIFGLPKES